jgi:hypothetical protein
MKFMLGTVAGSCFLSYIGGSSGGLKIKVSGQLGHKGRSCLKNKQKANAKRPSTS